MKKIKLTQGMYAMVDDEDFEELSKLKWRYDGGYARGYIHMHRLIAQTPKGMDTDHINGDKLDNRRSNLRACTHQQNSMNRGRNRRGSISELKGVYQQSGSKNWFSAIQYNRKIYYLGSFESKEDAALAYDNKATEFFGEFARLNYLQP